RIIKDHLRGRMNAAKAAHYEEILEEVAKHSSETERRAEEAERETDKLKKAQYMENHVGEVFEGIISGVTAWGMFVELDNSCEGMIRAVNMTDDFYIYDENAMKLVGERFGKEYCLGQKVTIRVVGADRLTKTIDFRLLDEFEEANPELFEDEDYGSNEFVVYSDARKVAQDRANKVRRIIEMSQNSETEETHSESSGKTKGRKAKGRVVDYNGEQIDLSEYEPDPRTGEPKPKKAKGKKKEISSKKSRSESQEKKASSGRKVYKVHKYKKSATSKATRSAQGKGRKRK
ncbi:MAG: S1 RNA-binding domain-containing protein, partial [Butyrivibrio sp.]|nr:S1 RNA-binding domain-containing protein [Butyrivibrio sp.]